MTTFNQIRKFTGEGEAAFRSLLANPESNLHEQLSSLVSDNSLTVDSALPAIEWEAPKLRLDVGRSLYKYLNPSSPIRNFAFDKNLWNWLSAAYLSQLGTAATGLASARKDAWVFNEHPQRYYRHALFSAYFVYENHLDNLSSADIILLTPLDTTLGEVGENLLATPDIAYSVALGVATRLYWDGEAKAVKAGASSKSKGTVRRFAAAFINQMRLNVDFKGMTTDQIWDLLPKEFDRFKNSSTDQSNRESIRAVLGDNENTFNVDELKAQLHF